MPSGDDHNLSSESDIKLGDKGRIKPKYQKEQFIYLLQKKKGKSLTKTE